jgi:hypothetical protein
MLTLERRPQGLAGVSAEACVPVCKPCRETRTHPFDGWAKPRAVSCYSHRQCEEAVEAADERVRRWAAEDERCVVGAAGGCS